MSAPDPKRPLMMMRFRPGHEQPEVWNALFPHLIAGKAAIDEVWFSTGVGFPPLEVHRKNSALMAEHACVLRKEGILPGLQIQTTIGHSDRIISLAGAEGKTWGSYVGVNGEECKYVNCPRQEGFLKYMGEISRIYAQWHPSSVWVDDDLRLYNHDPAMEPCGCHCKDCLALFGREEGKLYSREELAAACKADIELYKRWEKFSIASLQNVIKVIVENFQAVSPETVFGLQHCQNKMRLPVIEAFKACSGKRVGSRPGGGAYSDHNPYALLNKGILISLQIADQQGYETLCQIAPEIESCPRTFTCKTSQGHRIESLYYLALGCDSLSYFILAPDLETQEWYGRELIAPLAAEAPCYKEFIAHNAGTAPGGIGMAVSVNTPRNIADAALPLAGVPFAGCSSLQKGTILTCEAAEKLPGEELEKIFARGCILDGFAAAALQARGLSRLTGGIKSCAIEGSFREYFTDDPLNEELEVKLFSHLGSNRFAFEIPQELSCRVLGVYKDCKMEFQGVASVLFTSPAGGRVALFGHEKLTVEYLSSARVQQLNLAADWVSCETLPLRAVKPVQLLFVPRVTEEGTLRSVTVINPTIGNQRPYEVLLRGVPEEIEAGVFHIPAEPPVKVPLRREGKVCKALLPALGPWAIGWLKI